MLFRSAIGFGVAALLGFMGGMSQLTAVNVIIYHKDLYRGYIAAKTTGGNAADQSSRQCTKRGELYRSFRGLSLEDREAVLRRWWKVECDLQCQ